MVSALVSALHLFALALGLGSVFWRGRCLRDELDPRGVRGVLAADTGWGVAAALWLVTGLWRAFGGLEKGSQFYLHNRWFHIKMGLFVLVVLLELWPMVTFVRWRIALARGQAPNTRHAARFRQINDIETAIVVVMIGVAAAMARGLWMLPGP